MVPRYSIPTMTALWSDQNKFTAWLTVELAVIEAREKLKLIPDGTFKRIKQQAVFSLWKIEEYEKRTSHDLIAFVESVSEHLEEELQKYFHYGLTSYDIEDSARALLVRRGFEIIFEGIEKVAQALEKKARLYKAVPMIGRTHGQHAEPITVGLKFLCWYDDLIRQKKFLHLAYDEMAYTKISGAVGIYGSGLAPELEWQTLRLLHLFPARTSRQIILRDRHAHVLNALASLAGVLENIFLNIRLLAQTEVGEFREVFQKGQKGSSRMPHKRNASIRSEQLDGLSSVVRGYAGIMLEHIKTWGERDISHSSVERIIVPDAFQLVHYMLKTLEEIVTDLEVNQEKITNNLLLTQGIIFSPEVRDLLLTFGFNSETAYLISQQDALRAVTEGQSYLSVLLGDERIPSELKTGELQKIFDLKSKLRHVDDIFARFGL